ncbi:unnamed protein product [Hyaloperonospora brassicae]|uniref:FYVE-type domain-containing protein n=1 Tax=Hyaloperonospora brassicae TaxID=162125 RepID=A0AAV0U2J8_HYABA|nr:unnamed protein product [Hyaloperonospora brassicae]
MSLPQQPSQPQQLLGQDGKDTRMGRQRSASRSNTTRAQESLSYSQDPPYSSPEPQRTMWVAHRPSNTSLQSRPSHPTTKEHGDNFESLIESLWPGPKRRSIDDQELHQQLQHSYECSNPRAQIPLQILDSSFEQFLRRSMSTSSDRTEVTDGTPTQQRLHPSQHKSVTFWQCQQHRGSTSDSTGSTETYVELPPIRRREIVSRLDESVRNVMASVLSDEYSNVSWKYKFHKKDISYYMDENSVGLGQARFCCVTQIHATVDEFVQLFQVSDPDTMARNNRVLSGSLHESRVLSVLRQPTQEQPMNSMYVRYVSCQAPELLTAREMCGAIATELIRQPDGSAIGFCFWDTVNDPEFAEAANIFEHCAPFRAGFFLQGPGQTRSSTGGSIQGYTKVVYVVESEHGGWAPGLTSRLLMEKFGANLARLRAHFRRKQLDSRTFVMKTEWRSKRAAKSCKRCKKHFQVLSHRVNCHACGHVVCKACVSKELVELHAVDLVSMQICLTCLKKVGLSFPSS